MMKYLLAGVLSLILSGCHEYYYKFNGQSGYSDLSYNRIIEVTYVGTTNMTSTEAKKYALYRIAACAFREQVSYVNLVGEKSEYRISERIVQPATTVAEPVDSSATINVTLRTAEACSLVYRPVVTLQAEALTTCSTDKCISVSQLIDQAVREGIPVLDEKE